jgi:Na+-driven multidrug efflux pump
MGYTYIVVVLQVSVIPIHIFCCWFFTVYLDYGIVGTAYATNVSITATLIIIVLYAMK